MDLDRWLYVVQNDLIGGFDLSHHNKPVGDQLQDERSLAWGIDLTVANELARLWNERVCEPRT